MFAFTMPIAVSLPIEKNMISRERGSVTYKSSAAYLGKVISVIPQAIAASLLLGTIVYWAVGLQADPIKFLVFSVVVVSLVLCSQALGMIVGSLVTSIQLAMVYTHSFQAT